MTRIRAVLFDLGGTLYDYRTLEAGNREGLLALARWAGSEAPGERVIGAHLESLREVFYEYLPKPYYLHRDLFRDALDGMARRLEVSLGEEILARYQEHQREHRERDFALREGVRETLDALRDRGLHLGIVSNIDEDQLGHIVALTRLDEHFDDLLSSEAARSCKPDPAIFDEALRRAGCEAHEVLFVGDTRRQDIEGANRAGMQSVLLWHRDDKPPPETDPRPRHVIRDIPGLLEIVG
jgi:putative hydrolase of the HAD superfamily